MPTQSFNLNGQPVAVDAPDDMALLWVLRDKLGVTGPKYGCGLDVCKACTCLIDGKKQTTCVTKVSSVQGRSVTTIEGLAQNGKLHKVQEAWVRNDVAQCGFCQPGQIMAAVHLLQNNPPNTLAGLHAEIDKIENMCRCGTYSRIRQAIVEASGLTA